MKVSGWTIVRNAVKYDYPIVEAINSILPICDEMVVAVGNSEDNSLEIIKNINSPKIKIIETVWDDKLREGGKILAIETNKALANIEKDSDWAFYIQADEIIHEKYLPMIKEAMLKYKNDKNVEGLLFNYLHFYGGYNYVGNSRKWYRNEIRIIRNDKKIYSFRDAQGFQKDGRPLFVKKIDAFVYHYGWVKPPSVQQTKRKNFHKFWHSDEWLKKNIPTENNYNYQEVDNLETFTDTHPQVMSERIKNQDWKFVFDEKNAHFPFRHRLLYWVEKCTGWRIGEYKNYKLLKN